MRLLAITILLFVHPILFAQNDKIDSLNAIISAEKVDTVKINLLLELHDLVRLSDFNKASQIAKESYRLALQSDWSKGIAKAGRNLGIAYSLTGKADSAILILENSLFHSIKTGDSTNIGYIYMTLGNIQYDKTNYDDALAFYFKCLDTYKSIDNYDGMSSALIWIGIIYQYSKSDFKAAISTYNEALKYSDLGNSTLNKGYIYGNLGTIYNDSKSYDSAILYYKLSKDIKTQFNDVRGIGNSLNNIGNVFYETGSLDSSLYYYSESFEIRKTLNDQTGIATSNVNIGKVLLDQNRFNDAEKYLLDGIQLARNIDFKEAWQQAAMFLSTIYEKRGALRSALTYFKEYKSLSDSIFNIESGRSISELQTAYETEKKEQQIALQQSQLSEQKAELSRNRFFTIALIVTIVSVIALWLLNRNRLRKKQQIRLQQEKLHIKEAEINATISSQEKERARYARDLHDGFGQMISILNMNLGNLRKDAKPSERQKVFEESEKVINDI